MDFEKLRRSSAEEQLEVDNTVSLHLRARRTGESEEGAALFVRAISRMHSRLSGICSHHLPFPKTSICTSPLSAMNDSHARERLSNSFRFPAFWSEWSCCVDHDATQMFVVEVGIRK